MRNTWAHIGLVLVCETCDGEVDLPDELESGTGLCRQCGIAFVVDAPYAAERRGA
jgi:hypothetical protein